ncbi:MAG: 4-hydroxybenzoate octaprenyltransferase [Gammaproteobacteria bacterium]|nr:MAG: 4-hydroxybenzoate octaprenyltransferase [Gammaproteobacteria bacterium]
MRERLKHYALLMRLHKPIGILLLLWPTLWALWLAGQGQPHTKILLIFTAGVVLMRSAGCVLNDVADRHVDGRVRRTRRRPLAMGLVTVKEAILLVVFLSMVAFLLVLQCNLLTIALAFVAVALVIVYPLMKRFTHLPQIGLGAAFSWGVPMAFAAETGIIDVSAWFLFLTSMIWPVIYDTMYAMADRADDLKIGVKSTAILFDQMDKFVIGLMQTLFLVLLVIVGLMFQLNSIYYFSLIPAALLFIYQQWLIKDRNEHNCFRAFLNNNWVGLVVFAGILISYLQ